MDVHVTYYEKNMGYSREPAEDDQWDHGDRILDSGIDGVLIGSKPDTPYYETREFIGDPYELPNVYVVYALYYDGDTFGSTSNYIAIADVCGTYEQAKLIGAACRDGSHREAHRWKGYFSGLCSVEIQSCEALVVTNYV